MNKDKEAARCLRLPSKDRADLAADLLASLEKSADLDTELAWFEEAERRYALYRQGKMKANPAATVLQRLRAKLR